MKLHGLLKAIITFIFLSISTSSFAGWNFGFSAGSAKSSDSGPFDTKSSGSYLYVGYLTDYLIGIELGAGGVGKKKEEGQDEHTFTATSLSVVFNFPMGDVVSVFAKAGQASWALYVNEVETETGSSPTFGAGINFHLNQRWALLLEHQRYTEIGTTEYDIDNTRFGFRVSF